MIQYEYYTLTNETYLQEGLLNALGERGWELATHMCDKKSSQHAHVYTFKKQKSLPFGVPNYYSSREITVEDIHNIHKEISDKEGDRFWNNPALYAKLENMIIEWAADPTKTAGELTRQILKLVQ